MLQSHGKMIFIYFIKEVNFACVHMIIPCVCIHTNNTYISIVVRIHWRSVASASELVGVPMHYCGSSAQLCQRLRAAGVSLWDSFLFFSANPVRPCWGGEHGTKIGARSRTRATRVCAARHPLLFLVCIYSHGIQLAEHGMREGGKTCCALESVQHMYGPQEGGLLMDLKHQILHLAPRVMSLDFHWDRQGQGVNVKLEFWSTYVCTLSWLPPSDNKGFEIRSFIHSPSGLVTTLDD